MPVVDVDVSISKIPHKYIRGPYDVEYLESRLPLLTIDFDHETDNLLDRVLPELNKYIFSGPLYEDVFVDGDLQYTADIDRGKYLDHDIMDVKWWIIVEFQFTK